MIEVKNLQKVYKKEQAHPVYAIKDVSLQIASGEFVAILGPSGSGKSTLMNTLGLLDKPDSGEYRLLGQDVFAMKDAQLAPIRNRDIGFVFQAYHLLPRTTAIENVQLPLLYANNPDYERLSHQALEAVGLAQRKQHFVSELSGGQQQRVAIARAIVNSPKLILADEPTGNLDSQSQQEIIELFKTLNAQGTTVVLITHAQEVAHQARRIISIRDGEVLEDRENQRSANSMA